MREFPADPGHFSACPRNASLRSSLAPTAPREKIPLFQVGLDPDSIPVHPSPPDHGAAPCQSPSCCPAGNLPCFSWNSRAAGGCEGWDAELLECLAFPQSSGNFRICCAIDGWQGRLESDEAMDMQGREMWIPGSTEPGSVCLNSATGADSRLNIGKNPSPRGCWALEQLPREWTRSQTCQSSRRVWPTLSGMPRVRGFWDCPTARSWINDPCGSLQEYSLIPPFLHIFHMDTTQIFQRLPQNLQGEALKTSEDLPLQGGADSAARLFLNLGEQKLGLSLIFSQVLHTRSSPHLENLGLLYWCVLT